MMDDFSDNKYAQEVKINQNNITESLLDQPELYWKYAERYANLNSKRKTLERKLKRTEKKVERKVRRNPSAFHIVDVKEGAITAAVALDSEVIELEDKIDKIFEEENALKSLVAAYEHRRSSMKYLLKAISEGILSIPKAVMEKEMKEAGKRQFEQSQGGK